MAIERSARIQVIRAYDTSGSAGYRALVDRLWPRGVSKSQADIDEWIKDVAPSTELRRWYGHDTARFEEFARRYRDELTRSPAAEAVQHLVSIARRRRLTLITATRDVEHSGAVVLCEHLQSHINATPSRRARSQPPARRGSTSTG